MSKYGLFDKIGENETEEEKKKRKEVEEKGRASLNKKGYFSKLKDKLTGK